MKQSDRWTNEGIEKAIKEAINLPTVNASYDIYQRKPCWFERFAIGRFIFEVYNKVRNYILTYDR